jgi:hypothetical protein
MIENIIVGAIVLAALVVIGRKIWRMRCLRARNDPKIKEKCGGCPGCGPG